MRRTSSPATPTLLRSSAVGVESGAVFTGAGSFILSAATGFIVFHDTLTPLWSEWPSVGILAMITGSVCGAAGFAIGSKNSYRRPPAAKRLSPSIIRHFLDTAALIFTHVAIYSMLCFVLFAIFQDAFQGLKVDALTATMLVGLMGAVGSYFMYLSASTMTTYKLSTLLMIFVTSGVMMSMVTANDPRWWEMNFSALGMSNDLSGYAFNGTVVIAGAVITTLANYITADLTSWARSGTVLKSGRVALVRWALVLIGIFLACVGIVPVNVSVVIHNTASSSLALVFFTLVVSLRFLVPGFPKAFFLLSYALLVVVVISALLFFPIGYYNLTAFELIVSGLIFGWLAILIRNIAAVSVDSVSDEAAEAAMVAGAPELPGDPSAEVPLHGRHRDDAGERDHRDRAHQRGEHA